jgi:hypothetical protein
MPEVFYVQRGKKKYAYTSTSVYEPGKKYPKTVNEYLGILDEETGKIIPKKNRSAGQKILDDDTLTGRRFGGSYLLLDIAERIGLREDLFRSFGPDGERVLACAVAQALSGGPFSSTEDTVDGCMIRELQGIKGNFASPRMSELTKTLGGSYGNLEDLFEMRLKRTDSALSYDLTSASTDSHIKEWAEWGHNRDDERMKQMNVGLVTDRHGVPAMFELYPGSIADIRTLERTVERVRELKGGDCTLVMDRGFGSAANLKHMLENGMPFVIPGKKGTKCVKTLLSALVKEKHNAGNLMIHDRTTYSVYASKVAIVPKTGGNDVDDDSNDTQEYELILPDDPRFADAPENMVMTAHACYDSGKAADDMNSVYQAVSDIEAGLNGMNPYSALRDVKKVAGPYAKYFDLSIDDEGKLNVERKRNALSFSMNRNGMFVMFSKGIGSWEDMMSCYDCRTYVEQAFDSLKNELDGNRWRVADPITAKGRLVIKFVALILWCTMSKMLRDGKSNEPVRTALQSMDNILAVGCADEWKVLEITKRNRKLMELFDMKQPEKKMVLKDRQYIPRAVIDEAYSD